MSEYTQFGTKFYIDYTSRFSLIICWKGSADKKCLNKTKLWASTTLYELTEYKFSRRYSVCV